MVRAQQLPHDDSARARAGRTSRARQRARPLRSPRSAPHQRIMLALVIVVLLGVMGEDVDALVPPRHIHKHARFLSTAYAQGERADPNAVFQLAIGLHARDFDAMERKLWQVSNPQAVDYGRHLSKEEADQMSQPKEGAVAAIQDWVQPFLGAADAVSFSPASNTLKVPMSVYNVEQLLGTEMHEFVSQAEGRPSSRILRAVQDITIPGHLQEVVAFLNVNAHPLGLRALASAAATTATLQQTSAQGDRGTLGKIRDAYNIPSDLVVTNETNTQCVPSFYTESYSPDDLQKFFKDYLPGSPVPPVVEKGNRVNDPKNPTIEASLDIQYITGVARNATTYMWTMGGSNPYSARDEPFLEFAQAILEMEKPPYVVSISYSDDEEEIFKLAADYARSFDTLLIKMGLRGITVLVASGDDGVAGLRPEFAKLPRNETCAKSGPQWPSSSPYITSVGATMLLNAGDFSKEFFRTDEEVVCSGQTGGMVTGGGGFSNVYGIPEYQQAAVARYLQGKRIPKSPGYFNKTGRAYPDISALGASYRTRINGGVTAVSGTSASTPVVGAMVTLWNDARLNAGKSPLGFINPLLYYMADVNPSAFNDVVIGNNGARKGGLLICDESFGAAGGWDAATGVGTPNFPVVLEFIQGLEDHFNLTTPLEYTSLCDSSTKSSGSSSSAFASQTNVSDGDGDETETASFSHVVGTVVVVVVVMAAGVISAMLLTTLYKRWRNQYTSLSVDASTRDSSSTSSPNRASPGSAEEKEDDDDRNDVELSEISLHE